MIMDKLASFEAKKRVCMISQDAFYKDLDEEKEKEKARKGEFNFDHPDAFKHEDLVNVIKKLEGWSSISSYTFTVNLVDEPVQLPKYDFCTNSRIPDDYTEITSADVILVEGILIFYEEELRKLFNIKLFVDVDPDIRLSRRIERDTNERGRSLEQVIHQYLHLVKPSFEEFCLPTKKYAGRECSFET